MSLATTYVSTAPFAVVEYTGTTFGLRQYFLRLIGQRCLRVFEGIVSDEDVNHSGSIADVRGVVIVM